MTDYFLNDLDDVFYIDDDINSSDGELSMDLRELLSSDRHHRRQDSNASDDGPKRGILKKPSYNSSRSSLDDTDITETDSTEAASNSSMRSLHSKNSKVSFDTVEIREYQMILDDSAPGPAALTIDWNPVDTDVTSVLRFECLRQNNNREEAEALSPLERASILMNAGYQLEDMCFRDNKVQKELLIPKKQGNLLRLKANRTSNMHPPKQTASRFHDHSMKAQHFILYSKVKRAAQKLLRVSRTNGRTVSRAA